jgi:hypothetical protein
MATGERRARRSRERTGQIDFAAPAAALLRLRALVGVSARAEVLLRVATASQPIGLAELAALTGYTKQNIAMIVALLADAGEVEIERSGNRDIVRHHRGSEITWLRRPRSTLVWPDWAGLLPMLIELASFVEQHWSVLPRTVSALVAGRTIAANMDGRLAREDWPRVDQVRGADFEHAFDAWITKLASVVGPRP